MKNRKGSTLIIIIIFGFVFTISIGAIAGLIMSENRLLRQKIANEKTFQIAEAGLNYYRWQLAHEPLNLEGVVNKPYYDPQGDIIGYYTIEIESAAQTGSGKTTTLCHKPDTPAERTIKVSSNSLTAHLAHGDYEGECEKETTYDNSVIAITVTANTIDYPNLKRIIRARYGLPSLAKYAFATNSNVWFGEGEEISGTIHSNGGIRMDGTCNGRMTSIKETYICGSEHGCDNEEKPGIWGTGEKQDLWDFPVTEGVDFEAVSVDLEKIKEEAIASGVYLENSGAYGYLLSFENDGSFDVKKVKKLEDPVWGYNGLEWVYEANSYKNLNNVSSYNIPANGLIFVEDDVWVEGEIDGRATVVAARLPDSEYEDANIYIQNSITYPTRDGSCVLGLIAQKDILVPLQAADDLIIDAAMIAQKGHIFRYYYSEEDYPEYAIRNSIENYGTIITNTTWTWSWVSGAGEPVVSGYEETKTFYDPYLLYGSPPSFPSESEYEFISWEEISAAEK